MVKSTVVDSKTGKSKDSRFVPSMSPQMCVFFISSYGRRMSIRNLFSCIIVLFVEEETLLCRVRTSSGMFLRRGRDKVIKDIEKRIADFAFIPVGKGLKLNK